MSSVSDASSVQASVIVPTHDRDTTLGLTIASIQAQTVRDIEIIIVGDGVTQAVREVVAKLSAEDQRIQFLDYVKAPGRGYDNRHRALLSSRGKDIFYSDDDDLWFPDHVEQLGKVLAKADVADSAVLSVARSGRLHRAIVQHANKVQRQHLATGQMKLIFDTHLAHSRALYTRLGNLWSGGVSDMLSRFAASDAIWGTLAHATALSLHGSVRRQMTPQERQREAASWHARIVGGVSAAMLSSRASTVWYLYQMLLKVHPQVDEGVWDYLRRSGIERGSAPSNAVSFGDLSIDPMISDDDAIEMEAAFELFRGAARDGSPLRRILFALMEPVLGPVPHVSQTANAMRRTMPPEDALKLAASLEPANVHERELGALLRAELLIVCGRPAKAKAILQRAVDTFEYYSADAVLVLARQAIREKHPDRCIELLRSAAERFDSREDLHVALAEALSRRGSMEEAASLCRRVLSKTPQNKAAAKLLSAIDPSADPERESET